MMVLYCQVSLPSTKEALKPLRKGGCHEGGIVSLTFLASRFPTWCRLVGHPASGGLIGLRHFGRLADLGVRRCRGRPAVPLALSGRALCRRGGTGH